MICPVCGSKDFEIIKHNVEIIRILICRDCGWEKVF